MKHVEQGCFTNTDCDNCYGCHLSICKVCKCYEGSLTTECPGVPVSTDEQDAIYKDHTMDFTQKLGWHVNPAHESIHDRIPQFESATSQQPPSG